MRLTFVLIAVLLPSALALEGSVSAVAETAPAAADCSFILWAEDSWLQTGRDYSVNWTLIQTESVLAQCKAALDAKIESQAETLRNGNPESKVEIKANIVSLNYVSEDKKFFSFRSTRYLCVPDKIDPRPKAR